MPFKLGLNLLVPIVFGIASIVPDAAADEITFTDVIAQSGMGQVTQSLGSTIADFNGDGLPDVFLNRHAPAPAQLWLNRGHDTFALSGSAIFPAGADVHGCAATDVNGDRRVDLYCTVGDHHGVGAGKSNHLWLQGADGTFVDEALAWGVDDPLGRGRDAAFLDVNGDGRPDLFVFNAQRNDGQIVPSRLFVNTGTRFVDAPGFGLDGAFWALDGVVPTLQVTTWHQRLALLAVTKLTGPQLWVQHAIGGRFFLSVPPGWPMATEMGARLVDLNRDGRSDLVAVSGKVTGIWQQDATGSFVRAWSQPTEGGRAVAVADLTGDGLPDLYVTTWSRDNLLPNPPDLLFVNHRNLRFTLAAIPEALTGQGASASVVPYGSSEALLVSNGPNGWVGPLQLIVATDSD